MRRKEFNIIVLLSLLLAILSFCFIVLIYKKESRTIVAEHDAQLYSLAYSVDRNLLQKIDELSSELHYILSREDYREIENQMIESGNCSKAIQYFNKSHLFTKVGLEGIICTEKDTLFSVNQTGNTEHTYTFLPDKDEDTVYVCYDETGKYSIALQENSTVSELVYYLLLDLNHFYDTIIPPELHTSHWVVFMDSDSGLCLQNHENQDPWILISYEEMMARNDGYSIIARNEKNGTVGAETYLYVNYFEKKVHERLITIPTKMTANKVFCIGISLDSENLYKEINGDFYLTILVCGLIVFFGIQIYRYSRKYIQKALDEKRELEIKHEKTRMQDKLRQMQIQNSFHQLQPHFLYNALSSIREIVLEDPEEGADLIYDFTTYLRACLKSMTARDLITFDQELKNIEAYTSIEKMRFGEKLNIQFDIKEKDFYLIPLGIQPLVENAIRHGIGKKRKQTGTVWVRSYMKANAYVIEVEDNGIGFDPSTMKSQIEDKESDSTGLRNLILRFREQLNAVVEIQSETEIGTKVTVRIPIQ